jgi:membrane-bound ClpP family serine protease
MFEWLTILLLIVAGLSLLLVELIFVPGTTIVGISGGLLVTFGVIKAFNEFGQKVGYTVY